MISENDLVFSTPQEIAKELAQRAKEIRVNALKLSQKAFAAKMGLAYGKYQRFEQSGDIRLDDFILVLSFLGRKHEITGILKPNEIVDLRSIKATPTKKRLRVFMPKKEKKSE